MTDQTATVATSFLIKDCALIAIATGKRAQNLRELKEHLQVVSPDSVYYHFWGGLLRPKFDDPEYHNDLAVWVRHGLHDKILAERLSLIVPTDFETIEDLRQELIEVIEERLDELDYPPWATHENQFEFIRAQIVIFDTHHEVQGPGDFVDMLPHMSVGSIFYHFIDARRRNESGIDDFRNWLRGLEDGYPVLCQHINEIDPYFSTLAQLRRRLTTVFKNYFKKGRA